MAQQQEKIDQIVGVKADLIASLNEEFQKNQLTVEIDYQTGAIVLDSSVLFDYNESELTDVGMQILEQVLPVYCKVLLSDEYEPYLAEVIIDGYTDTTGDYITNLRLSQERAFAVAEYLMNTRESFLTEEESDILTEKLTSNGRSLSNPILDEYGNVDMDASRRVEIKFRLKDEEMLAELEQMIEDSKLAQTE
jgi:chemotaxis protein MotB